MPDERYPPDDPREWMRRARSALSLAQTQRPDVYLEDLCYQAQQAAEKAIKAVLIARGVAFPYVHDLAKLLTLLERAGQTVPEEVKQAEALTRFAVFTRYPGAAPPIAHDEYEEAVELAKTVMAWASAQVEANWKPR